MGVCKTNKQTEQHDASVIKYWSALHLFVISKWRWYWGPNFFFFFKSNEPSALFRFHCKHFSWLAVVVFFKSTWPDKKSHALLFHQKTVLPGKLYVSVKKGFTKTRCVCVVESTSCAVWCRKSDFPKPFWGVAMISEQQHDSVHYLPFHNPSALSVNDLTIINRCWFEQSFSFCFTFWQNVQWISGICSPALAPSSAAW